MTILHPTKAPQRGSELGAEGLEAEGCDNDDLRDCDSNQTRCQSRLKNNARIRCSTKI